MQMRFSRGRALAFSLSLLSAAILVACGGSNNDDAAATPPVAGEPAPAGAWTKGDLHVHTVVSDDAQIPLEQVLDKAFDTYGLDWVALSNHLRTSSRDHTGAAIAGGPIAFSKALELYEAPVVKAMQENGKYVDKLIFSSFEWDMPTHDHVNVGILGEEPMSAAMIKAVAQFEYLFTNRNPAMFDAADVAEWSRRDQRAFTTHEDSLKAIEWLKKNYPDSSYMLLNHPSRYTGKYTIAQLRQMNDISPDIMFMIEGMVGNQMEPDRGGYATAYVEANRTSRTYGGVDYLVSRVGGTWDALLGEGRRIWNVADSDYHFTTAQGLYSSGYAPGEYSKTHVWVDGDDMKSVLAGLKSGKLFGVHGDLIDALDFKVSGASGARDMGGELAAAKGEKITLTIRFRSPERNNYEYPLLSGNPTYVKPTVDHVDLIVGDVTGRKQPGTPGYSSDVNPSTRVLKRFNKADWKVDAQGYNVITFDTTATGDQYFRLRGTNLGVDVPGETANGEPLADAKVDFADNKARFDAINARNYNDLWFYSNPVFVKTTG